MKKALLLLGLLGLCAGSVYAHPRDKSSVTRITRNDGNSRNPFAITCASNTWTLVGSSNTTSPGLTGPTPTIRRRSLTIQMLSNATYGVCISSVASQSGQTSTCVDGLPGYELGAAWGSVSIFDENPWYCQARTGGSTAIKGVEFYDNRDETP